MKQQVIDLLRNEINRQGQANRGMCTYGPDDRDELGVDGELNLSELADVIINAFVEEPIKILKREQRS